MAFRDGPFDNFKVPLVWTAAVAVVVAGVAAGFLLLTDKREDLAGEGYGGVRGSFDQVTAPAGKVLSAPVRWTGQGSDFISQYFFAVRENRRLREQVAELESLRDANIALRNVNARYESLLKIRTQPAVPMATARAISESRGPFVNARLIDAGSRAGIRVGNPVVNEHGLVGRIVGVTTGVSRVLLVTDVASRTPVLIDRTDARAIMVGDGGGNPRLDFVRGHGAIKEGDRILTSGDGGMFPRGLPVGVAAKGLDGSWRVRLFSDRGAIDFVRILLFQDFSQLVDPAALNAPPLAALETAPAPDTELTQRIQQVAPARTTAAPSAALQTQGARAAAPSAQPQGAAPAANRPAATTPGPAQATQRTSPPPTASAARAAPAPATAKKSSPPPAPARRPDGTPRRPVPYERLNPGGAP